METEAPALKWEIETCNSLIDLRPIGLLLGGGGGVSCWVLELGFIVVEMRKRGCKFEKVDKCCVKISCI